MPRKPISLARNDYMEALCNLTNQAGLPAFVVVDVLERLKSQLEKLAENELARDRQIYQQALKQEQEKAKTTDDSEGE